MNASTLRRLIDLEEFDSLILLDRLREYAHPRDRITELLRSGDILRVKKGIYVFGPELRRRPICRELLANWIYGPSYLSLEFALQFHGLIPEGVEELTSVTTGRSRRFSTPLGVFSYRQIPLRAFPLGMDRVELDNGLSYLMATPEKALADKLVSDRRGGLASQSDLREYLVENLRIAPEDLATLNPARLREIADGYRSRRVRLLGSLVERMNGRNDRKD